MYDAVLHQAIYHYNDSQLGGFSGNQRWKLKAREKRKIERKRNKIVRNKERKEKRKKT